MDKCTTSAEIETIQAKIDKLDSGDAATKKATEHDRDKLVIELDILKETLWAATPWQSFSFNEFNSMYIPPIEWCLKNFMTRGSVNVVCGPGGVGKSMFTADLAVAAATGCRVFWGWRGPLSGQRVLYVDGEMPASILKDRWTQIIRRWKITDISNLTLMPVLMFNEVTQDPNLFLPIHRTKMDYLVENHDLIVLDNFNCLCRRIGSDSDNYRADENTWTELYLWMRRWCAKGKTFLFVMHTTKTGSLQGTSRITGDASTVIQLGRMRDDLKENIQNLGVIVEYIKGRSLEPKHQELFGAELMSVDEERGKTNSYDGGGPWLVKGKKQLANDIIAKQLHSKGVVTIDDMYSGRQIMRVGKTAKNNLKPVTKKEDNPLRGGRVVKEPLVEDLIRDVINTPN